MKLSFPVIDEVVVVVIDDVVVVVVVIDDVVIVVVIDDVLDIDDDDFVVVDVVFIARDQRISPDFNLPLPPLKNKTGPLMMHQIP